MANRETMMTLEEAVGDVLGPLTGIELDYQPELNRFQSVTRALNRALKAVALEHEWSYYASTEDVGISSAGQTEIEISSSVRPRIINDDAIRLVTDDGTVVKWAYFIPRDALHKYRGRGGLWASVIRTTISFSRPLFLQEAKMHIMVPVMREPRLFRLPKGTTVSQAVLRQQIDFDYPDLVIARAQMYVADADPVMQPRVQTLEARYKDIMYQLIARDDAATDAPYSNEFIVPIMNSIDGSSFHEFIHLHPHADERH